MTEKRFGISFTNKGCSKCLFLNSSDTGEDCKILKSEICEDEWSNIDYQFEKNWRYEGCPLIHHENLNEHKGINAIKEVSIKDSLSLLKENNQLTVKLENRIQKLQEDLQKLTEMDTTDLNQQAVQDVATVMGISLNALMEFQKELME